METRRHIFGGLMLAAAALVCLTGCKKDDEGEKITLGVDFEQTAGMQKTYIGNEDKTIYWSTDDSVKVNGKNYLVHDGVVEVNMCDDGYAAVYPATNTLTYSSETHSGKTCIGGSVVIPATQNYVKDDNGIQQLNGPMAARLDTKTGRLLFRNLYAVIKVTVKAKEAEDFKLNSITVESTNGKALAGTQPFTFSGSTTDVNNIALDVLTDVSTGVTLNFGTPVTIPAKDSASFYLYTVPFSGANLTVKINGNMIDNPTTARDDVTVPRSCLGYTAVDAARLTVPFGGIGRFKVGDNRFVTFAPGNLMFNGTKLYFADHQYDVCPESSHGATSGVIDVFTYATNNNVEQPADLYTFGRTGCHQDWFDLYYGWASMFDIYHSASSSEYEPRTYNNPPVWTLLTETEYLYLLANQTNGKSSVKGVQGIVLLPYEWQGGDIAESYTEETWTAMESNGAVFLPAQFVSGNAYIKYWLKDLDETINNPDEAMVPTIFKYLNIVWNDNTYAFKASQRSGVRLVKYIE